MIFIVISKIEQLQKDLATENAIMDKLAAKTKKVMVLSHKLNYVNKHLDDLESEKAVIKTCVSEINQYMNHMVETRDSILTIVVLQHLTENLKPIFDMWNRIECVSRGDALLKQAGEPVK